MDSKIDNYLIALGIILLVVGAMSLAVDPRNYNDITIRNGNTYTFEDKDGRTLEDIKTEKGPNVEITENTFPLIRTIITGNGLAFLLIGSVFRAREKKIIKIWNALEQSREAKINDLSTSLGLSRNFIINHIKDLNGKEGRFYIWDKDQDKIIDSKLKTEFLIETACEGCGNNFSQKISLSSNQLPTCKYCGSAISSDYLNKIKQEFMLSVKPETVTKKEFSTGIFIFLLIFFWPGAIYYLIKYRSQ